MFIRKSQERGHNEIAWLDSYHSFSFGSYHDPKWQGFNQLLVINEDRIAPAQGFGAHPHKDMEIITYVIEGEISHKDSMGNHGIIKPGEIQVMSAGTGITHSEFNNKKDSATHLLQIWVHPAVKGVQPRYDQKIVYDQTEKNILKVIAAPAEHAKGLMYLNANAQFWLGKFESAESRKFKPAYFKNFWIQLIKGSLNVNNLEINAGDAIAFSEGEEITIDIAANSEFLIIEVA